MEKGHGIAMEFKPTNQETKTEKALTYNKCPPGHWALADTEHCYTGFLHH